MNRRPGAAYRPREADHSLGGHAPAYANLPLQKYDSDAHKYSSNDLRNAVGLCFNSDLSILSSSEICKHNLINP